MRQILILVSTLSLILFLPAASSAQWNKIGISSSEQVFNFNKSATKYWAFTFEGLYSTTDLSQPWTRNFPEILQPYHIFTSGDTLLFAYFVNAHLYDNSPDDLYIKYSINEGTTWTDAPKISNFRFEYELRFSHGIISYHNQGVYYSRSVFANTFTTTNINIQNIFTNKGNIKLYKGYSSSSSNELKVTLDNFTTTTKVDSAIQSGVFLSDSTIVYCDGVNIYRTTNFGNTKSTAFTLPSPGYISFLEQQQDSLYAIYQYSPGTDSSKLLISPDKGINWIIAIVPTLETMNFTSGNILFIENNHTMIINNTGFDPDVYGIYKYNCQNDSNVKINEQNMHGLQITQTKSNDKHIFIYSASIIQKSSDGQNWTTITPSGFMSNVELSSINVFGDTIILVQKGKGIIISFDEGNNWNSWQPLPPQFIQSSNFCLFNKTLFIDSFYSPDFGATWLNSNFNGKGIPSEKIVTNDTALYAILPIDTNLNKTYLLSYSFPTNQWLLLDSSLINNSNQQINFRKVHFVNNKYFATNYNSNGTNFANSFDSIYLYSNDLRNWYHCDFSSNPLLTPFNLFGEVESTITFHDGIYLRPFLFGTSYFSNDGIKWKAGFNTNELHSLIYFGYDTEFISFKNKLYNHAFRGNLFVLDSTLKKYSGTVYHDNNNNGIQNVGEKLLPNLNVTSKYSNSTTDSIGRFELFCIANQDTMRPQSLTGINYNPTFRATTLSNINNNDFALNAPIPFYNAFVDIQSTRCRPGFESKIVMKIQNQGTQDITNNDTLILQLDSNLSVLSFNVQPDYNIGNSYYFLMPTLTLFDIQSIQTNVLVNITATLGNIVDCKILLKTNQIDIDSSNNKDSLTQVFVGAYDPNEKVTKQNDIYNIQHLASNKTIDYTIHFQNEGTLATDFVRIVDTLSPLLDWSSFKITNSSAPYTYSFQNGILVVTFKPLHLEPKSINELESQGFVSYSIVPKKSFKVGDSIENTAFIYFDFNKPIATNTHYTKGISKDPVSINTISSNQNYMEIFPNPAETYLQVIYKDHLQFPLKASIVDVSGKLQNTQSLFDKATKVDISNLRSGIYFLKILSVNGNQYELPFIRK